MGEGEDVLKEDNVVTGEEAQSQDTTGFKLEARVLEYAYYSRRYHSNLGVKHLNYMSVAE